VKLIVRENDRPLAEQQIVLKPDADQSETIMFNAGAAGSHSFQIGVVPMEGEQNTRNNSVVRVVNVSEKRMRILYMEGEPRWDFKFIRRAITDSDDPGIDLVTMLRTTQNKIYRQGTNSPQELENGFPATAEELFNYDGLILGSVEASSFSNEQQRAIVDFADRRGGGVLFTAGRFGLSDGDYAKTPMAEMMPLRLTGGKTFIRDFADTALTEAGRESVITRLEEDRDKNIARWKKMPQIANYATVGDPKPGAVVLMTVAESGRRPTPLLAIQNYGRGRVGILATEGTWRWKMLQDHTDTSEYVFWQQLMRWMVTETPGKVVTTTPSLVLSDDTYFPLRVSVRDKKYEVVSGATVDTTITRPDGGADVVSLKPDPLEPGTYTGDYTADKPGTYVAETVARQDKTEVGRDTMTFRREDGVAENFGAAQNRDLLEKLSHDTGGNYYTAANAKKLPDEIAVSEAGIVAHDNLDIWDMPAIFLLLILIRGGEWLLRRKWGVV
jgi:uncharacterized membrane protein